MRYATPETVYRLLEIDPLTEDQEVLDDLDNLEEGVALALDERCNRTFGEAPAQETREISYAIGTYPSYGEAYTITDSGLVFWLDGWIHPNVLPYVTPAGMRNVTAVSVNGDWDGTVWDDPETVLAEDYRLVYRDLKGWSHGILLPAFGYGSVRVTAEWEDQSWSATVPADIREAATFLTADQWRILHQSPHGEIGPPGLAVFLRNTWEYEIVKSAIRRNRFYQIVA